MENAVPKKSHWLTTSILICGVVLFILILAKGLTQDPNAVPSTMIGKPARDFTVEVLQGGQFINVPQAGASFSLANFKGKPVVLNFWASWCHSCRAEARELEAFWQKHRNEGIILAGIAIQDTVADAMQFAKTYGKTYLLGLDTSGNAALDYGVSGVPETFLIDKDGVVQYKEAGPMSVAMIEAKLPLFVK